MPPRPRAAALPSTAQRRATLAAGCLALLVGVLLLIGKPGPFNGLTNMVFDTFQRASPRVATADPGVVIIDIDEASLATLGQWPWPRDLLASLIENLGAAGVAAIGFDMAFTEPDRTSLAQLSQRLQARGTQLQLPNDPLALDNDLAFAAAIAQQPVVLGVALSNETGRALAAPKAGISFAGSDPRLYLPRFDGGLGNLDALTQAAQGLGSFSFPTSRDNIIRAMPLVAQAGEQLYPGLGLETLRVAQQAPNLILRSSDGRAGFWGQPGLEAIRVGALTLPADHKGQFYLHYSGMPHLQSLSAKDLLGPNAALLRDQIEGRIALIGTSAIGLRDLVATPLATGVPGVIVHAELIDQVLQQSFLTRPDWARGAELAAAVLVALILIAVLRRGGTWQSLVAFPLLTGLAVALAWMGFQRQGLLLDPVPALVLLSMVFIPTLPMLVWLGNRDRRFVRAAFGRYLSPALVERLSHDPSALELGGETREITLLFSDIRGFTTLSEHLGPHDLTELLNGMLTPLTDILLRQEATIDKYIGDAVMAFWNAPLDIADHPLKACRAALAMQAEMQRLNATNGTQLAIGLGLHLGQACVGNLGSAQRFSYSAIGDTVNLAARVEGMTKQYALDTLITDALQVKVPQLATLEADRVRVVGRQEPVVLHILLGDEAMAGSAAFQALRAAHSTFLAAWSKGDFAAAGQHLEKVTALAPQNLLGFYQIYADRLTDLRAHPPAAWDGIHTATKK